MTTQQGPKVDKREELSEEDLDSVTGGTHELTHVVQQGSGPKVQSLTTDANQHNQSDLTFIRR